MSPLGLPIAITDLLHGRSVEWERLEFKTGWNPQEVLHSMCSFANDFHNLGGGYILIGVEEQDGRPVLPPRGVDDHSYFLVRFPVHSKTMRSVDSTQATPQVAPQATPQVKKLLSAIRGEMDREQLQTALGLKARKNFRQAYLMPALDAGLIEMTQPDSPRSPTQRYRLTEKGRQLLKPPESKS